MKRIAIFCDGTWNSPKMPETTHVRKLFEAAKASDSEESKQIAKYFEGVGARSGLGNIEGWVDKIGGGALGWGLSRNVKEAYSALAQLYEEGDEIFLFGFSRGAFTARSLAGMIRKSGLPDTENLTPGQFRKAVKKAFKLYKVKGKDNAPDKPHIIEQRQKLSPRYSTSRFEKDRRGDESFLLTIKYLGIWDTVGALGVPDLLGENITKVVNRRHQFHDLELSRSVKSARHAIALDERRYFFKPSLWENLDVKEGGQPGLNEGDKSDGRPYQQKWFAGDHSHVGGSGGNRGLTSLTMDWIAQGAIDAEMILDTSKLLPDTPRNALSPAPITIKKKWVYGLNGGLYPPRKGPKAGERHTLSEAADQRVKGLNDYRPDSLRRLLPEIF